MSARTGTKRTERARLPRLPRLLWPLLLLAAPGAIGGEQQYEELADSARAAMHASVSDLPPDLSPLDESEDARWLAEMESRLQPILPQSSVLRDSAARRDFLRAARYEALRAGVDPQWLLAVIHIESAFRKYAISSAGARGYMQVMPFWVDLIGEPTHNLFHLRTNLRYGAVILRHYLDREKGDYFRALGRYNGSLGRAKYPDAVHRRWQKRWRFDRDAGG